MEIVFTPIYIKSLRKLPKPIIEAANDVADKLYKAKNLSESGVDYIKLKGEKDYYRIRIGDYRIIAKYVKPNILMLLIGSRGDIYKKL